MNKLDLEYQNLLKDILENGVIKNDRTGTGTLSIFSRQIRHKMSEGFPLLTTKKIPFKTMVKELMWMLRGSTGGDELVRENCNIWVGDMYSNYLKEDCKILPNMSKEKMTELGYRLSQEEFTNKIKTDDEFAKKWGELGPIYGKQWRNWNGTDQIKNLIEELQTNPDSRRLMVSAWNVGELNQMVLPPCHYGFQIYTRELNLEERLDITNKITNKNFKDGFYSFTFSDNDFSRHYHLDILQIPKRAISLMWNQRSVDTGLGLGFNIASYGLLLEMIATQVNMIPDELIGNLGDVHLYKNHIEPIREQLTREPFPLPKLRIKDKQVSDISEYKVSDFELVDYQSHPTIKLLLSN